MSKDLLQFLLIFGLLATVSLQALINHHQQQINKLVAERLRHLESDGQKENRVP